MVTCASVLSRVERVVLSNGNKVLTLMGGELGHGERNLFSHWPSWASGSMGFFDARISTASASFAKSQEIREKAQASWGQGAKK